MTEPATAKAIDRLSDDWKLDEAEELGRRAVREFPDDPARWIALGKVQLIQYRREAALESFERAVHCPEAPALAVAWQVAALSRLRRFEAAEKAAEAGLARFPDDAEILHARARVCCDQEDWAGALPLFEQALAADPGRVDTKHWQVLTLASLKRFDEAEEAGLRAIDEHPGDPQPLATMGWMEGERDREEEALAWHERALEVDPRNEWALRLRVNRLSCLGRSDEAEAAVKAAIELRPREPRLWLARGWVDEQRDRGEEALTWYERALEIAPRYGGTLWWRVRRLRLLERFDDAETALREALEIRPDDPDLLTEGGALAEDQSRLEEALDWVGRALAVEPRDKLALLSRTGLLRKLRRFAEAEAAAREAVEQYPDDMGCLLEAGEVAEDRYRFEEALSWAERAAAVDPGNRGALENRVFALRRLRRFDAAEEVAREATDRNPEDPGRWVLRGWVAGDRFRFEEALACFRQARDLEPGYVWALLAESSVYDRLRRFEEAKASVRAVLDQEPDNVPAIQRMAALCRGHENVPEAIRWYERALEVDPRDAEVLCLHAAALRRLRRFDEARAVLSQAFALCPDEPGVLVERAFLLDDEGHFEQSLDSLRQAVEADPLDAEALKWRVTALGYVGRFEQAEAAAEEAIERRPDEPDLLVEMGLLHDAQLKYEESLGWFDRALRIDPFLVEAITGRSAALRSLRRFDEAERGVAEALERMPWSRSLREELVWIYHDSRRLDEAGQQLALLRADARDSGEEAETAAQSGWIRFAAGDYPAAEERFRAACEKEPDSVDYQFGLAWCLVRQATPQHREEAEKLCFSVLEKDNRYHAAHTCLGVLNYQRRQFAQAEQHFRRAVELDPNHASYVDLGALYSQLGRFDEAEKHLNAALERDWCDAQAHVELGYLELQRGIDDPEGKSGASAARHFRQAQQIDPANGSASLGLAVALMRSAGDFVEGEDVLQQALRRGDCDLPRWQLLVAVAKLLIERGDATQGRQFHADALAHAQEAISLASQEAEPYFVAAVARYKLAESAGDFPAKPMQRRKAIRDLRRCVKLDPGNVEAQRSLQIMEESLRITRSSTAGSVVVVVVGIAALIALWVGFFLSDKITGVMLTTLTPVLVGLMVVGLVLPFLIRLKLPGGVEADLGASIRQISSGPTGEETFGPGRFSVTAAASGPGPRGQLARL